jgi:Nif-specific regulatory protein
MMRARLTVNSGIAWPRVCEVGADGVVNLGRNRENTIVLHDRHASRWHAQVFATNGRWFIRDQGTTNGTRLDGEPIVHERPLVDGQEIAIGEVRLVFNLHEAKTEKLPGPATTTACDEALSEEKDTPAPTAARLPGDIGGDLPDTVLQADELTVLFRFMNESLAADTPHRLVSLALETVQKQTRADLTGFLSLDAEAPELLLVVPEQASVDKHLSQQLTHKVLREGRAVWLSCTADVESESLSHVRDAVCVPLCAGPSSSPLGALHVYKSNRPFSEREVRFCQVLANSLANALHALRARCALEADNSRLRVHAATAGEMLIGESSVMRQLRDQIARLADCPCNVLILGESGVGKELVALGLHRQSQRGNGALVPVNCAAICATLPESQLFGHKRGAFTGATADHPGLFMQADLGTLFLDEVGELPLDIQAKLLRALETKRFLPVGARAEVKADVRILAATNRDLESEVREGTFREDLFYRLRVTRIKVPPLREHLEDVPALAAHFLGRLSAEYRRRVVLSEGALQRLQNYSWPGNVRQLRSVLEAAVAMAGNHDVITAADLHLEAEPSGPVDRPPSLDLEVLEQWAIREALTQTGGNNTKAAVLLGIHRDTLIAKLKKYNIERRPATSNGHRGGTPG